MQILDDDEGPFQDAQSRSGIRAGRLPRSTIRGLKEARGASDGFEKRSVGNARASRCR